MLNILFLSIIIFSFQTFANPLEKAIELEDMNQIKLLLKSTKYIDIKNAGGDTPLQHVIKTNQFDIAKLLFHSNANLEIKDKEGNTALLLAIQSALSEIVEDLILAGANIKIKNKEGLNAIEIAEQKLKEGEKYNYDTESISKIIEILESRQNINEKLFQTILDAKDEKRVRRNPKNILEYLLLLPSIPILEEEVDKKYSLRIKEFQKIRYDKNCKSVNYIIDCIANGFPIFDTKNEYIKFKMEQDDITLTIFKQKNGRHLIGVDVYYGGDSNRHENHFFYYENQSWIEVTDKVLPELDIKLFLNKKDYPLIKNMEEINFHPRTYIELPQFGTNAFFVLDENCYSDGLNEKKCKSFMKYFYRSEIPMKWDKNIGKFKIKANNR